VEKKEKEGSMEDSHGDGNASIMIKAMYTYINNEEVAEEFCKAVISLTSYPYPTGSSPFSHRKSKRLLISAGVNELLVKILITYESSHEKDSEGEEIASSVLEVACRAIVQFTHLDKDSIEGEESGSYLGMRCN
jgi:hypothetical protein